MYNTAAAQKLISSTKFNKSKERLYSILKRNIALFGHTNDRETTSYKQQFTFKKIQVDNINKIHQNRQRNKSQLKTRANDKDTVK